MPGIRKHADDSRSAHQLAGSVTALSSASNRVDIVNNSSVAAGLLVSGTNQVGGNFDGSDNTQVNAGSELTVDHIIENALIIRDENLGMQITQANISLVGLH